MSSGHRTADLFHFVAGFPKKQRPCFGLVRHGWFVLGVVFGGGLFGKNHDCFDRTPQQQDAGKEERGKGGRRGRKGEKRERSREKGRKDEWW